MVGRRSYGKYTHPSSRTWRRGYIRLHDVNREAAYHATPNIPDIPLFPIHWLFFLFRFPSGHLLKQRENMNQSGFIKKWEKKRVSPPCALYPRTQYLRQLSCNPVCHINMHALSTSPNWTPPHTPTLGSTHRLVLKCTFLCQLTG